MKRIGLAALLVGAAVLAAGCHRTKTMDGKIVSTRGSYALTCRNVVEGSGTLSGECLDAKQQFHASSLQTSSCKGDITNTNGVLSCAH